MTCEEAEILLQALLDGELDAGHAREVEVHVAQCPRCAARLQEYRGLRAAVAAADPRFRAPPALRQRIEAALPGGGTAAPATVVSLSSRRSLLEGLALGSGLTMALAASLAVMVFRGEDERLLLSDVLSAHLRSLRAEHLTDVVSSDQHTVKPWFNGKLDVAPPVVDLTAQGFPLVGGRLDFIAGKGVAAIVYRRHAHVINLFVMPKPALPAAGRHAEMLQGFNILRWSREGLSLIAISDVAPDDLQAFADRFDAALPIAGGG